MAQAKKDSMIVKHAKRKIRWEINALAREIKKQAENQTDPTDRLELMMLAADLEHRVEYWKGSGENER